MGTLVLLGFASLLIGLVLAEVDPTFTHCRDYFYGRIEPLGFNNQNSANICQKYNGMYSFATFYDMSSRIPVWSAYTLPKEECKETSKTPPWKLEPQLSSLPETNMKTEGELINTEKGKKGNIPLKKELKESQAIDADYDKTGYDRGHLNPNAFQCDENRKATFTLTNAVPMDPCFNRIQWGELERYLKKQLRDSCLNLNGKPFLVTGTVPNKEYQIPIAVDDNRRNIKRDAGRVAVPSHIWTAVCCDHSDNNQKFSFAFLGTNKPSSVLKPLKLTQLNKELMGLNGNPSTQPIKVFHDDCNEDSPKAARVLSAITKELRDNFPKWVKDASSQTESQTEKPGLSSVTVSNKKRKHSKQDNVEDSNIKNPRLSREKKEKP